jgi:hypothetical protein
MKKRIPYGISNFEKLKEENYYFIDKTKFLEKLELFDSVYQFFLRPRKFGKSFLISMLEYYYDIRQKDKFDTLFADTYIAKNPTPLKNTFAVLRFDFSVIKVGNNIAETELSFNRYVNTIFTVFINRYADYIKMDIPDFTSYGATDIVNLFYTISEKIEINTFLIIDEYDNFVNNILVVHGEDTYKEITHGTGFFRTFFAAIKALTGERKIDRMFITGVSPLVMSDVTSGFNIGDNISLRPEFAEMVGFNQKELEEALSFFIEDKSQISQVQKVVKEWYNGYCFNTQNIDDKIYNTTMIWYFLHNFSIANKIPQNLIDSNIRTDYNKLRFLISIDNKLNGNFSVLKNILSTKKDRFILKDSFSIGEKIDRQGFRSLLFYLGMLSFAKDTYTYRIPNLLIERLLWEFLSQAVTDNFKELNLDIDFLREEFFDLAYDGIWKNLFIYILDKFYQAISIRDFVFHEEGIKTFMLAYLNIAPFYVVKSEPEMNHGYSDIFLEPLGDSIKYAYIIELKYLKAEQINSAKKRESAITSAKKHAKEQLEQYTKLINRPVQKIIIVASAKEYLYLGEI